MTLKSAMASASNSLTVWERETLKADWWPCRDELLATSLARKWQTFRVVSQRKGGSPTIFVAFPQLEERMSNLYVLLAIYCFSAKRFVTPNWSKSPVNERVTLFSG